MSKVAEFRRRQPLTELARKAAKAKRRWSEDSYERWTQEDWDYWHARVAQIECQPSPIGKHLIFDGRCTYCGTQSVGRSA